MRGVRSRFAPVCLLALMGTAAGAGPADAPPAGASPPLVDKNKVLYELGVQMSGGIQTFELSESEFKTVMSGLADGFHHRADPTVASTYEPQMQALRGTRVVASTQHQKEIGRAFLKKIAALRGARQTDSGLVYIAVSEGPGASPSKHDQVRINYVGRLVDGTVYDSSIARGEPATLSLGLVMPCFAQALPLMRVGGKSRVVCPSDLAYGDRGSLPKVLPGATLDFDIELLGINPAGTAASSELSDRTPARDDD